MRHIVVTCTHTANSVYTCIYSTKSMQTEMIRMFDYVLTKNKYLPSLHFGDDIHVNQKHAVIDKS